ncbi:thermonuclease family protein [Thalassobacillus hwangdonensis]|uniref:Thermonuclease family protein n=1 Tax=Thalassobacillus hwangdonensis TaxID=546108 RepID=A0ABW3L314_9BACI
MVKNSFIKVLAIMMIAVLVLTNFSTIKPAHAEETEGIFFSEYVEGSSYNKALEIYNGTGSELDLSTITVELYSNGSTTPTNTDTLSGTLASGDVYVLSHSSAGDSIQSVTDKNSTTANFNGNDAVALKQNGSIIDVIGTIGDDTDFGADKTLVRNEAVTTGSDTFTIENWDAHAKDTFTYLGAHLSSPSDPEDPPASGEMTIAEARNQPVGTEVTVTGIVLADNDAIGGSKLSTYIQDETAGINLFAFDPSAFPNLKEGDEVMVKGKLDSYKKLLELVPTELTKLSENNPLPAPAEVTLEDLQNASVAEPLEGQLVHLTGYVKDVPADPAGGGYNISLIDENFNGTTLRVIEGSMDVGEIQSGTWYDITAILSQYDTYQIIPRSLDDLQVSAEQPEIPSVAGDYEATVKSVVDGDTIHLESPVLGTTKVRYVNIDTPETYAAHNDDPARDTINENQQRLGEAAKVYMNELLQQGDEVIVRVGEEATDDYGRLLAEVIRKEDNLNTNLKMVQEGYAVTYFLYPINEDVYPDYQDAVKAAKDAELGIWNPEDPLLELPFVFRANDDQKGFSKYVGNSDTMLYLAPEQWSEVPVEKRVFFWTEAEANEAGYTRSDDYDGDPEEPEAPAVTVEEAKALPIGTEVTVEGVVTSESGLWGSNGFYMQDDTAGTYVYQGDVDVNPGDVVRLTGKTDEYNGEFQLGNVSKLEVTGTAAIPEPVSVTPAEVNESNEGSLVQLEDVTITDLREANAYGTTEFTAVKGDESVLVRLDSRTGTTFETFPYGEGDRITITGLSGEFNGTRQLKPRGIEDLVEAQVSPTEQLELDIEQWMNGDLSSEELSQKMIMYVNDGTLTSEQIYEILLDAFANFLQDADRKDRMRTKASIKVMKLTLDRVEKEFRNSKVEAVMDRVAEKQLTHRLERQQEWMNQ